MVEIIAHRGASVTHHENTIGAFTEALRLGAQGIELDVHLSASGEPMVIHDNSLERTTNGHGLVEGYTAQELNKFDAGNGEHIPTLDKVLGSFHTRKTRFWIELKQEHAAKAVAALITSYISTKRYEYEQLIVISSLHTSLQEVIRINPSIVTGATLYQKPDSLSEVLELTGADFIIPEHTIVDDVLMKQAKEQQVGVVCWTVNNVFRANALKKLGVDGIITDDPALLLA
jgi:glycerophosphoryl diester phosphodiesterase